LRGCRHALTRCLGRHGQTQGFLLWRRKLGRQLVEGCQARQGRGRRAPHIPRRAHMCLVDFSHQDHFGRLGLHHRQDSLARQGSRTQPGSGVPVLRSHYVLSGPQHPDQAHCLLRLWHRPYRGGVRHHQQPLNFQELARLSCRGLDHQLCHHDRYLHCLSPRHSSPQGRGRLALIQEQCGLGR